MAKLAVLDESRSFGEVYGEGKARFEQDHKQFGADKREIVTEPQPAVPSAAAETLDEGQYAGWKVPGLRREIHKRTGKRPKNGVPRLELVGTLLTLDSIGLTGDDDNEEAADPEDGGDATEEVEDAA